MTSRLVGAVGIVVVACGLAVLAAQTPVSPAFEVASIKVNKSGGRASRGGTAPGGRFTLTNVTVFQMMNAFRLRQSQVIGGPGWINTDHFDVVAKMPEGSYDAQTGATPNSSVAPFLKTLLAERFHLVVHEDTRELTDATLVLARADGKLGPHIVQASPEDADCKKFDPKGFDFNATDPFKSVPPCSTSVRTLDTGAVRITARGSTMDQIASTLAGSSLPIVSNETGLEGAFNYQLEYAPEPTTTNAATIPDVPLRFTALQEQLGLKIVLRKEQMPVIVIDHVEHPTEN